MTTPSPGSDDSGSEKAIHVMSSQQMNMRGVFLHVLADALGSVIVCISACVIMYVPVDWIRDNVDPTLSVIMVCLILTSTWGLLVESAMILLQTVPTHIQIDSLQRKLLQEVREKDGCHSRQLMPPVQSVNFISTFFVMSSLSSSFYPFVILIFGCNPICSPFFLPDPINLIRRVVLDCNFIHSVDHSTRFLSVSSQCL